MKAKPAVELCWEPTTFTPAPAGLCAYYFLPSELVKLPAGSAQDDPDLDALTDHLYGDAEVRRELRAIGVPPRGYVRTPERAIERPIVGYAIGSEDGRLHALTLDDQARVQPVVSFPGFERVVSRAPQVRLDVVGAPR